ncbi:nicolin-1-like [Bacillus rossius redtenbacheri]|uniref:nicolin-1-like n=1 Tax=Bacillus rossius redtenbacheri TaxID=93214 RepID=UPI002FDE8748
MDQKVSSELRQPVPFSVRGPTMITIDKEQNTGSGCSVIDIEFPVPSSIGEVTLINYYTAWLCVLVRPCSVSELVARRTEYSPEGNAATDAAGGATPKPSPPRTQDGWVMSIRCHTLMSHPHYEQGSQDFVSLPNSLSAVKWDGLLAMRLVLFQPSPVWKTFHMEQIALYHDAPRHAAPARGDASGSGRRSSTLVSLMHFQTQVALEQSRRVDAGGNKELPGPCSYEFCDLLADM